MTAHAFYTRNESTSEFLFRAPGRHPNVRGPLMGALFLKGSNMGANGQGLRVHASSRDADVSTSLIEAALFRGLTLETERLAVMQLYTCLERVVLPSLTRVCFSTPNSQKRADRSGLAASFPLPTNERQNRTLRSLLTCWNRWNLVLHVLVFFAAHILLCGVGLAFLGRKFIEIPLVLQECLKKSLPPRSPATLCRIVIVFTCFSSALVFSSVPFMASLYAVFASEASWHLSSSSRFASSCHSRV